jgi:hypothetical protein
MAPQSLRQLGLSDSVLADRLTVDSSLSIGALEALLFKNRISSTWHNGRTTLSPNQWSLRVKALAYLRAVATREEKEHWSQQVSCFPLKTTSVGAPTTSSSSFSSSSSSSSSALASSASLSLAPSPMAAAAPPSTPSVSVMLLVLEKRVKRRLEGEELRTLGAVSAARALTLSSLDRRIGKLNKKDPMSDSRMKEAPGDLDALIASAGRTSVSTNISSGEAAKKRKGKGGVVQKREKRSAAGLATKKAAKEATAMRLPPTQNTEQDRASRMSEGGEVIATPSSPSPSSSLSLAPPPPPQEPQSSWLQNIFRA